MLVHQFAAFNSRLEKLEDSIHLPAEFWVQPMVEEWSEVEELLALLAELDGAKKVKPRDVHEVTVLKEIYEGDKVAVVRRCLTEIYVATT